MGLKKRKIKLWCDVYVATANASNTVNISTCEKFADAAIEAFEKRFDDIYYDTWKSTDRQQKNG